jgi:hypothetical protein
MKTITTENLIISEDTCKRLDGFVYGVNPNITVMVKHGLYKDELINLISKYNPDLASKLSDNCLYYVYCTAERVLKESGILGQERGRANMQTAHNQLGNYK